MREGSARLTVLVAALAVVGALVLSACQPSPPASEFKPKLRPPAIRVAGVLRVGVDPSYPPFASREQGSLAGLDVDVAAALADGLGLDLELVDVTPADAGKALRDGRVDVALGAMPITDAVLSDATFAGTYLTDGPALFSSAEGTVSIGALDGKRVAVQQDSAADRLLTADAHGATLSRFPTLRGAFGAAASGQADVVAGDAIVGAYMARDFPGMAYRGQLDEASPLGVAVAKDDAELDAAVRDALDALATGGVLDAVRSKWVGSLPPLPVASPDASAPPSGSVDTTTP